jgi:hypothetical protein
MLDGSALAEREGLTFLLVTNDVTGWPRIAMLSVGELVAAGPDALRAALWLGSTTSENLTRDGRALLAFVANGKAYYVRLTARRGGDLDLGTDGHLARFDLFVQDILEDAADYATLTSGVTFRLTQPEHVVPRWQRTVTALLGQEASA